MNRFAAAGGTAFVFRELMDAGLMHDDIATSWLAHARLYRRTTADGSIPGESRLAYAPAPRSPPTRRGAPGLRSIRGARRTAIVARQSGRA